MSFALWIFGLVFLFSFVQGHPSIIGDYHARKIVVEVLNQTYENYLSAPVGSPLRKVVREEYLNYYKTHYLVTFTWLHQVVANTGSLPGENLLDIAAFELKGNRNGFLHFMKEVKIFAIDAYNAEMRYLILSEQPQALIKSMKVLFATYLTDIDEALDLAVAHFDFESFYFKNEIEMFVKKQNLDAETAHQEIHDFLAKKYPFRSWMVSLYHPKSLNVGCHRHVRHVTVPINDEATAVVLNIPHDSTTDEQKATKLYETAKTGFSFLSCTDDTDIFFKVLNIHCGSLKWAKVITLFYDDSKIFKMTATNMQQVHLWKVRISSRCKHKFALVIFG